MVPLSWTCSSVQSLDLMVLSGIVVLVAAHTGWLRRLRQTKQIASPPSAHSTAAAVTDSGRECTSDLLFSEVAGCTTSSLRPKCPMFRTKFLASTHLLLLRFMPPYNEAVKGGETAPWPLFTGLPTETVRKGVRVTFRP